MARRPERRGVNLVKQRQRVGSDAIAAHLDELERIAAIVDAFFDERERALTHHARVGAEDQEKKNALGRRGDEAFGVATLDRRHEALLSVSAVNSERRRAAGPAAGAWQARWRFWCGSVGDDPRVTDLCIACGAHIGEAVRETIVARDVESDALRDLHLIRDGDEPIFGVDDHRRRRGAAGHGVENRRLHALAEHNHQTVARRRLRAGAVQAEDQLISDIVTEPLRNFVNRDRLRSAASGESNPNPAGA
jgi:hypothetical protein